MDILQYTNWTFKMSEEKRPEPNKSVKLSSDIWKFNKIACKYNETKT